MVRTIAFLTVSLLAVNQASAVFICGNPVENRVIFGDEIATNPKNAGDSYACCNQCDKEPNCVAFTEGGTSTEQTCQLFSKVRTMEKTEPYLTFKGYVYQSVFMQGREAPNWGQCGNKSGYEGCNNGYYCQPWDENYYQCVTNPGPQCRVQTNVDYYGDDLKKVTGLTPGSCCDECAKTPGCEAYTFVNDDPEGRQCYLKKSANDRRTKIGVISGSIVPVPVPAWALCGDAQKMTGECPSGYYCQPWDKNYHQCIPLPAPQCSVVINSDYYGNNLKTVKGLNPGTCCDECTKTQGCVGYTFVNDDPEGTKCYLKSSTSNLVTKAGVISGSVAK